MIESSILLGEGINIEQHQETREVYRLRTSGRACRVQITNTQGRIRIVAVKLEGRQKYTRAGTEA